MFIYIIQVSDLIGIYHLQGCPRLLATCDFVVFMERGQVIEQGQPDQLLASPTTRLSIVTQTASQHSS